MSMKVEMIDPAGVLEKEIAAGCDRKSAAMTYAYALRQGDHEAAIRMNKAILSKWSLAGLRWIKDPSVGLLL